MNNRKNYKVIIVVSAIILLPMVILLIINFLNHNDNPIDNIDNIDNSIDESTYFTIQRAVVDYLEVANNFNIDYLYDKMLDEEFIRENNINKENITEKLDMDNVNPVFVAKKIIKTSNKEILFYFVNGYRYDYKYDGNANYKSNDNYLVIVNNNRYVIRPLKNDIDITLFSKNFDTSNFKFSKGVSLTRNNNTETNKLSSYIAEFLNLLDFDNYRAYESLTNNTKNKYINYDNFYNESLNIYNSFTTKIDTYSKEVKENVNYYYVKLDNGMNIKIIEYSPMNYQLEF